MRQIVKHPLTYNLDYETPLKKLTGEDRFQIGEILLLAKKGEEKLVIRSGEEEEFNLVEFIPKAKIVEMIKVVSSGTSLDVTEIKEQQAKDEQKIEVIDDRVTVVEEKIKDFTPEEINAGEY